MINIKKTLKEELGLLERDLQYAYRNYDIVAVDKIQERIVGLR